MIEIAEDNIYNELMNGNWQASKFVLERLNREKWGNNPQVVINEAWPEAITED
jgi:hypothetical protein